MYFGVDYHPEQWVYPYAGTPEDPEASWRRDAELMVKAGVQWGLFGGAVQALGTGSHHRAYLRTQRQGTAGRAAQARVPTLAVRAPWLDWPP